MTDDQENTWRVLQGKDMLVSRKCWWGWHKWTKWKETGRKSCPGFWSSYGSDHIGIQLERKCTGCGMPQIKLVRYRQQY